MPYFNSFFRILILLLFFNSFTSIKCFAQQEPYTIRNINDIMSEMRWNKMINKSNPNIAGSPYLHDDFQEGVVYFNGKIKVEKLPLRLNLNTGEMEFMTKSTVMAIADPNKVDKVEIGQEVFIYLEKASKNQVHGFVKRWNDSIPAIITKMEAKFMQKEPEKPYAESKPDRFERAPDEHYVLLDNGNVERISSVKKLIQSLGSHETELADFAKKEKISASDPAELATIINYFNSLK